MRGGVEQLRATIGQLPEQLRKPLQIFLDDAAGDVQSFRAIVGKWYEDAMERVSGFYKRKLQLITLTVGLLIAVLANADTIAISSALAKDAALRSAVASYAEASAGAIDPTPAAQGGASNASPDSAFVGMGEARRRIEDLTVTIDSLQSIGLPLGWKAAGIPDVVSPGWVLPKLLGILLTALAISMGAPFWFDMLNKVVNIRGAGRAPEEKPKPPEVLPPARGA